MSDNNMRVIRLIFPKRCRFHSIKIAVFYSSWLRLLASSHFFRSSPHFGIYSMFQCVMSNFLHIFGGSKIRFVFVTSVIVGHNVYYLGLTSQQRRKLRLKKEGIDRFILLAVMGWQIRKDFSRLFYE